MRKKTDATETLIEGIIRGIFEKQGMDVIKLNLKNFENRIADYYIICHGNSVTQVESIAGSVEDTVRKETGEKPVHVEGLENRYWVLLDYSNVIVHVFLSEYRNFYSLESLWADAGIEKPEDVVKEKKAYVRRRKQ
ncbi:MAG: ribosome silencing factor [Bacteroidales bacterium]|nr:ribosome silencing factor [Bacteroidales bacterium]